MIDACPECVAEAMYSMMTKIKVMTNHSPDQTSVL